MSMTIFKLNELNGWDTTTLINIIKNICDDAHLEDAIPCEAPDAIHLLRRYSSQLNRPVVGNTLHKSCKILYERCR